MIEAHQNRIEELRESFKNKMAEMDNWPQKVKHFSLVSTTLTMYLVGCKSGKLTQKKGVNYSSPLLSMPIVLLSFMAPISFFKLSLLIFFGLIIY